MGYKMDICQVAALRIRKMRLEKNMTIDDLAEKCDVSTQTIKLIEAGRRNFKIKTLYTIANSLNVSSDYLIGRIDTPVPESTVVGNLISELTTEEVIYLVSILSRYVEILKKAKYDILFLDIRFNNCDIGIDVAKKLRKAGNTSLIILLTSLHSKAIEGYEIGAYRYIVKPIIKEKMYAVLDEAISSIRSNYRVILVKDMYNTVVVKIQQILYIYSNARKRCLVTLDGEIETWEQLKSIYEKLPQEQFAYAQKGFVVNYKMIKKLNKTGVELVNGENVPISRGMKNEFFANYFEFLGK